LIVIGAGRQPNGCACTEEVSGPAPLRSTTSNTLGIRGLAACDLLGTSRHGLLNSPSPGGVVLSALSGSSKVRFSFGAHHVGVLKRYTTERREYMSLRLKLIAAGTAAVAVLAVGGAAIANAATSQPTATSSSKATSMPAHGTSAHEGTEKAVTGTAATTAQAAAVKAAGSGTAGAVTSDFRGSGYEVTVTKSDGSTVEIHLDSSFKVMQGRGGFGGPGHGTAAHENAEKAVTGAAATKAQAAAVKSAGSGTAGAVTTGCDGSGYEVTVTKSDGSTVEIHLDSSFNVMQGPGGSSN